MRTEPSATITRYARQVGVLTLLLLIPQAIAQSQKPKADPPPDWPCRVVFRDAAGDVVRSDQRGAYVDGVGGVGCKIINAPGSTHHLWLFMNITGTRRTPPTRSVTFEEQTFEGATYPAFQNHGTFEVKGLATMEWNPAFPTARDVLPFRAYLRHPDLPFAFGLAALNGDSNFTGGAPTFGTSSVFVQPLDACSWRVTSYSIEEPILFDSARGERSGTRTAPRVMRITEGNHNDVLVGDFPMPFEATVVVTGVKPGC